MKWEHIFKLLSNNYDPVDSELFINSPLQTVLACAEGMREKEEDVSLNRYQPVKLCTKLCWFFFCYFCFKIVKRE